MRLKFGTRHHGRTSRSGNIGKYPSRDEIGNGRLVINRYTGGLDSGAWLSLVERQLWELDVAGSNPVAPTIYFPWFISM